MNKIAKNLKVKTISNLRDNDIKNGGQGAPIGSYYHKFLIQKFKEKVIIVNLGGRLETLDGNAHWNFFRSKEDEFIFIREINIGGIDL